MGPRDTTVRELACTLFAAWGLWEPFETTCVPTATAAYEQDGTLGTASGPAVGCRCYAVTMGSTQTQHRRRVNWHTCFCSPTEWQAPTSCQHTDTRLARMAHIS